MSRIKQLEKEVYSKIAAGEIIERPASILRELLDNAIDSEADMIEINLLQKQNLFEIIIKDNGYGIHREDLQLAFERHATSKINNYEDIFNLNSLGFRGEALASISAVSEVTLKSSIDNSGKGYEIQNRGGEFSEIQKISCKKGTTIIIKDLFFNTPVRKKFLKSLNTERSQIKKQIIAQLLSCPRPIAFKYILTYEDKEKIELQIPKNYRLFEKLTYLYPSNLTDYLIYLDKKGEKISIKGYISNQKFRAKTRKDQFLFVNGRSIENKLIFSAISNAYINILPSRTYPCFFLEIKFTQSLIDVNTHPSKKEIKIQDNDQVYRVIYHAVKEILYHTIYDNQKKEFLGQNLDSLEEKPSSYKEDSISPAIFGSQKNKLKDENSPDFYLLKNSSFIANLKKKKIDIQRRDSSEDNLAENNSIASISKNDFSLAGENKDSLLPPKNYHQKEESINDEISHSNEKELFKKEDLFENEVKILGQLKNSFILFIVGSDLFIGDQHAIHERINFENLQEVFKKNHFEYQVMLVPVVLTVGRSQVDEILALKDKLLQMGLEIEKFGEEGIKLDQVPSYIPAGKEEILLREIFDKLLKDPQKSLQDILEKITSDLACKMSIRAGESLSHNALKNMLKLLYLKDYIYHCPHGRPFLKKITYSEIENYFERH